MKNFQPILILLLMTAFIAGAAYQSKAQNTGSDVLQKVSDKLNSCQTISYDYYRSVNAFSEDYHSEISGTTFLDFENADTVLGFKFQLESEQGKTIYNGAESFYLNKKDKTIKISYNPALDDFEPLSFFVNSVVTLKKVLPTLIADKEIAKTLSDTTISNKRFYLVSFVLHDKTITSLGTLSDIILKRDFLYKLIVDEESFLPISIIQTNNAAPKDYLLTSFSNIISSGIDIAEDSWYYSTYTKDYKPASEETLVLIKQNTASPDWQLPLFDSNDTIALSNLKGKVVLLEFWIKNCGYCVAAVPKINALVEKYKAHNFEVIGINSHDTKEEMNSFY